MEWVHVYYAFRIFNIFIDHISIFYCRGDSEGLYEQLPVESGHGPDDGSISPTGFIDGPPLSPSDDSELYASVFNQENGEHLVKPSQIKNRRSLQAGILFYYQ